MNNCRVYNVVPSFSSLSGSIIASGPLALFLWISPKGAISGFLADVSDIPCAKVFCTPSTLVLEGFENY